MEEQAGSMTLTERDSSAFVVEARALTKVFRDFWRRPKVRAVSEVSFGIRPGEVFGLLGPNGSGKTTTLKLALGLLHPTEGGIRVLGRSPRHVRTKARIGYLPEEACLYPYLSAEEALNFYGRLFDLNGRERRQRIGQLLEMTGLLHARNRLVGEYSKGMSRRIGLAQALINDPELVILDEPTSGLDPMGCRQVKDLIRTLAGRGKTVLLSSHLLADVEDVCDRVAILYSGKIRAMGAMNELLCDTSQCSLTLPELPPAELKRVLGVIREVIGEEPAVSHPRKELETFFIQVVNEAREQTPESTGSTAGGEVAAYLRSADRAENPLLESLTRASAPEPPSPPHVQSAVAPPEETPPADKEADAFLQRLVQGKNPEARD
ncbi:MAG: ABC transporter ATP-binding protein [Spartobacteria bacterium]|nr:ABC transporter ATP-binding protein [Spartobacteria bacterium]